MNIEIIENGQVKPPSVMFDDYDLMENIEELKFQFKDFVFNYKVVKYFGIDLVWQQVEFR